MFSILWPWKNVSEKPENHFVVESTTIESMTYIYKATLSKWTCHKEHSFSSIYFIFFRKFCFNNLLQRVGLKYQLPKCPYSYFLKAQEFCLRVFFPMRVSLKLMLRPLETISIQMYHVVWQQFCCSCL